MRRQSLTVLGLCISWLASGGAHAEEGRIALQPHRAVYDLTLSRADEGANIDALSGRMVYEFTGSPCDGYTTTFRFVTRIQNGDNERVTDLQTTNFESADGKSFRFTNKTLVNGSMTEEVSGTARETGEATQVALTEPEAKSVTLEASRFPTVHMVEMLKKAEAGTNFYQTTIFDGSENADKVMATTVVIGKPQTGTESGPGAEAAAPLSGQRRWPVSIAYFDEGDAGEGLPTYRTTFLLYPNGITRDLLMDYGDFAITGKLTDLKLYDKPSCPK